MRNLLSLCLEKCSCLQPNPKILTQREKILGITYYETLILSTIYESFDAFSLFLRRICPFFSSLMTTLLYPIYDNDDNTWWRCIVPKYVTVSEEDNVDCRSWWFIFFVALGHIGSVCSTLKSVTDITISWPDISGIKAALDSVYNALKPILDFFDEIRKALQERLCIPDPLEALREWELLEYVNVLIIHQ